MTSGEEEGEDIPDDGDHALVDAHVHVWDPSRLRYAWLDGVPRLNRAFLPSDVDRASGTATRMVFVQAACRRDQALDEVRWVQGMTDAWPELVAIVADADLRSGAALERHLDALATLSETRSTDAARVVGVRHLLQDEPDGLLADGPGRTALLDGLRAVAAHGMTFDVCVRHDRLDTVVDLLEEVPELPVVLDHVGKPPVRTGAATSGTSGRADPGRATASEAATGIDSAAGRAWARAIDRLADLPSAAVKLSGLPAEASDRVQLDANAGGFLVHALRAFGASRAMLGSDWPVSALTGAGESPAEWRRRVRSAARTIGATDADLAAIEHGTADRFYRLGR